VLVQVDIYGSTNRVARLYYSYQGLKNENLGYRQERIAEATPGGIWNRGTPTHVADTV
jgi:hypothetical protein